MENEEQRLRDRRTSAPAQQAPQIERRAKQKQRADRAERREERPAEQTGMQDAKRRPVDPAVAGGKAAARRFASQFRVKLGTIRPATTEIRTITAASPRRHPSPGGTATSSDSRCISRLAMPRTATGATIGRLRQFLPATISRATTPTRATGNDRSAATASHDGTSAETRQTIRPSSHNASQQRQRPAADRTPPGPVWDGGQQKAGDSCHHEAEQHLVDMPGERIEPARQRGSRGEHDDPDRERRRRPEARGEKERPETLGQKGRLEGDLQHLRRRCS